ncbi:hypothetical protein [Cohnella cellulosilytica]|uniref:Fibronectin type-III domain-containing protein n=1 Tax=Cohnella cellulosilytica TaxID=986710 RepID=A0ABW2FKQ6_9BACL
MATILPSVAGAESTSLLGGKTIRTGSNPTNLLGSTVNVTDNNPATSYSLPTRVSDANLVDFLIYNFSTPQTIDAFKLHINNYNNYQFIIGFRFSDGKPEYLLTRGGNLSVGGDNAIHLLPQSLTNVIQVFLVHDNVNRSLGINEWDFYKLTSNLTANSGDSEITLDWTTVDGASSYVVKRSTSPGGPYDILASGLTNNTYVDLNVVNGVTYYYVIDSIHANGVVTSNEASATLDIPNQEPEEPTDGRALLTIYVSGGQIKEYDLSAAELNAYLNWYDAKDAGSGPAKYAFTKTWNKGPFKTRTEYVIFDKILTFDVDEYEVENP